MLFAVRLSELRAAFCRWQSRLTFPLRAHSRVPAGVNCNFSITIAAFYHFCLILSNYFSYFIHFSIAFRLLQAKLGSKEAETALAKERSNS